MTALLRGSWRDFLAAVPGAPFARPTEVAKTLGVRPKLGWQVWRVMHASDPLEALDHMPGRNAIDSVVRAARELGATAESEEQLRAALREFGELVRRHAGDRRALAMMLAQSLPTPSTDADEEHRRHGFLAASYLWGVQARAFLMLSIMHPGETDDTVDVAAVRAVVDLRRLRPQHPWIIARIGCWPEEGETRFGPRREPLVPPSAHDDGPMLEEFCSPGDLRVRALPVSPTLADIELPAGPVGDTGLITWVGGEVFRRLPRHRSPEFPRATIAPLVLTPCKLLVHDILVHPDLGGLRAPSTTVFGDARGEGFMEEHERNALPISVSMRRVESRPDGPEISCLPAYAALVRRVHEILGWSAEGSQLYRLTLRYPVVPSQVATRFELPDPP